MKKRGFTLVELLAVIAILAILVIIALPNVLKMFRNAKENTFVTEVQEIVKTAEQNYLSGSLSNKECKCFSSTSNPLNLTGRNNIKYYVEFNDNGQVINLTVKDDNYQFVSEGEVINIADIGSSTSEKTRKTTIALESTEVPSCDGSNEEIVVNPQYDSVLDIRMNESGDYYGYFFATSLKSNKIKVLKFTNTSKVPEGVLGSKDVTYDNSGNIMMWWTDTDGDGLYEVTIGGEGGVRAGSGFELFDGCSSLTTLDLSNFDTSEVTSMWSMFSGCSNLTTLNLSNFDTSKVTTMNDMFYECSNLTDLDLTNFNTSKVKGMERMFYNCENLSNLKLSDKFVVNDDTRICLMFEGTNALKNEPYVKYREDLESRLNDFDACDH